MEHGLAAHAVEQVVLERGLAVDHLPRTLALFLRASGRCLMRELCYLRIAGEWACNTR